MCNLFNGAHAVTGVFFFHSPLTPSLPKLHSADGNVSLFKGDTSIKLGLELIANDVSMRCAIETTTSRNATNQCAAGHLVYLSLTLHRQV